MHDVPYGYCHCGCGQQTQIVPNTYLAKGLVKGEPYRFIHGHNQRGASRPVAERFWEKVDKNGPGGCWLWLGVPTASGYGRLRVGASKVLAHRLSYELHVGAIPDGLPLDHLCRNTMCVNPAHLEPVTHGENSRRGLKGVLMTHCPNGHPYDPENLRVRADGGRRCRACERAADLRTRPRKGNAYADRTHCPKGHPYAGDNLYVNPKGARCCRTCRREQGRARSRRLKDE